MYCTRRQGSKFETNDKSPPRQVDNLRMKRLQFTRYTSIGLNEWVEKAKIYKVARNQDFWIVEILQVSVK